MNDILCCKPVGATLRHIATGTTDQIQFECSNTSGGAITLSYEVQEVPASDDPTYMVLNLNGLPPGTVVQQSTMIPANSSVSIPIDVRPLKPIKIVDHDIVFSATIDASPVTALTSVNIETEVVDIEVCGDCDDGQTCTEDSCGATGVCTQTPAGSAPGEVDNGVRFAKSGGTVQISWNPALGASTSDIVRGLLSALPVGPGGGDEVCLGVYLAGGTASDPTIPSVGTGFWYLVRGRSDCGNGPFGFQGFHGASGAPRSTTTCP